METSLFPSFSKQHALSILPSSKLRKIDRIGVHGWNKDYAAFSETFAIAALKPLCTSNSSLVLDPFLGSGTSLVAARRLGLPFVGIDLNPFSALLSRAKSAFTQNSRKVFEILDSSIDHKLNIDPSLRDWFSKSDILYATTISKIISDNLNRDDVLSHLLQDNNGKYDNLLIAFVALLISARHVARLSNVSNPVWSRIAQKGERFRRPSLRKLSRQKASAMLYDLRNLPSYTTTTFPKLYLADARNLPLPDGCVDIIITSPPYLNRLDYVINDLPQLLLLTLLRNIDIEYIRKSMIGTTKIVEKGSFDDRWGKTCTEILKKIIRHPSKASSTYYIWNY